MFDTKAEQSQLVFQLGLLLRPVLDVINDPPSYTEDQRATIRARFNVDYSDYQKLVRSLCHKPDAIYEDEWKRIVNELANLKNAVNVSLVDSPEQLSNRIDHLKPQIIGGIQAIPAIVESSIYESNTPFSTYCRLLDLVSVASTEVVVVDQWVNGALFYRYLRAVPASVRVIVVTARSNFQSFKEFLDVSRLFARERGPSKYQLFFEQSFHDRWLKCDSELYHLGGSSKDAGSKSPYTLSKIDPSDSNVQKFQSVLNAATEVFGPGNSNHP